MAKLDILVLTVLLISIGIGLHRGFFKEVISLVGWFCAFVFANGVAEIILPLMPRQDVLGNYAGISHLAAFIGSFILLVFLFRLFANSVRGFIRSVHLGSVDSLFGALFGVARSVVLLLLLTFCLQGLNLTQQHWWREAQSSAWLLLGLNYMQRTVLPANYVEQATIKLQTGQKQIKRLNELNN